MNLPLQLSAPLWLGLLAPALILAWLERRRLGPRGAVWSRLAALGLLSLALADPRLRLEDAEEATIFVIDRSASIPEASVAAALDAARAEAAALPEGQRASLITFGATPTASARVEDAPPDAPAGDAASTDLGAALEYALRLIPADRPGQIRLWTDGQDTSGAVEAALAGLDARGVGLSVEPLTPRSSGPRVLRVEPTEGPFAPGATLPLQISLRGPYSGRLTVEAGGVVLSDTPVTLDDTIRSLPLNVSLPTELAPGFLRLDVHLGGPRTPSMSPEATGGPERAVAVGVEISRPPSILLLGHDARDTRPLTAAWEADGIRVTVLRPDRLPRDLEALLQETDAIALADVPTGASTVPALPASALPVIEAFVRSGGGLVVLGGEHAYDHGDYSSSRLSSLLPVESEPAGKVREPAVALVLILDKSGSMARPAVQGALDVSAGVMNMMVGGRPAGSKMELVLEAAAAAVEKLRPFDTVGLVAVDSEAHWAVPMQSTEPRRPLLKRIRSITAGGGGIFAVQALVAARDALRLSAAPIRHVILFADAADAGDETSTISTTEGRLTANNIALQLGQEGISLSVIGAGDAADKDAEFLRSLARDGGGRFELSRDIGGIRTLFITETERLLKANLEEAPFPVVSRGWHPALRGLELGAAPALLGRNKVKARPRARLLLATPAGAPILSSWSVGQGEVVALSADAGARWGAPWLRWSGYPRLWVQMARHFAARRSTHAELLRARPAGDQLEVELELRDHEGRSLPLDGAQARVADGAPARLTQVEPGLWSGRLTAPPNTAVEVEIQDLAGLRLAARTLTTAPAEEGLHDERNEALLARLPRPGTAPPHRDTTALWPWLAALAALVLPLDAWLRRSLRRAGA